MLVLCGLPPLIGNIHRARSNAERLFKAEQIANLGLDVTMDGLSDAALALVNPAHDSGEIAFAAGTADKIARDVDGYPNFIQWFGEALWDAADVDGRGVVDDEPYATHRQIVQRALDDEFYEPRYRDARRADQGTMRVATSLRGERFEKNEIDGATARSSGAIAQSLNRLIGDNLRSETTTASTRAQRRCLAASCGADIHGWTRTSEPVSSANPNWHQITAYAWEQEALDHVRGRFPEVRAARGVVEHRVPRLHYAHLFDEHDGADQRPAEEQIREARLAIVSPEVSVLGPRPTAGDTPQTGYMTITRDLREPTPGFEPGTPSLREKELAIPFVQESQ